MSDESFTLPVWWVQVLLIIACLDFHNSFSVFLPASIASLILYITFFDPAFRRRPPKERHYFTSGLLVFVPLAAMIFFEDPGIHEIACYSALAGSVIHFLYFLALPHKHTSIW